MKRCSVDGCHRPHSARGWCERHYQRMRTHGDVGDAPTATIERPFALIVFPPDHRPAVYQYFASREEAEAAVESQQAVRCSAVPRVGRGIKAPYLAWWEWDRKAVTYAIVNLAAKADLTPRLTAPTDEEILRMRAETTPRQAAAYRRHQKPPRFPVTTTWRAPLAATGQLRGQWSTAPRVPIPRTCRVHSRGQLTARATTRHGCGVARSTATC